MSKAIVDFKAAVDASFGKVNTAVEGLTGDVASLKKQIEDLQNSTGELSPEDQAALDSIQATANSVADKLAALDDLTPPPAPPA